MEGETRELTFGERAVGLDFNPSGNPLVRAVKEDYARIIDTLQNLRQATENSDLEEIRLLSVAITEAQGSCMWSVKAITWK